MFNKKSTDMFKPNLNIFLQYFLQAGEYKFHEFACCIKYLTKLITMPDHRFSKQCYNMLRSLEESGRITWASKIKSLLFKHGFGFVWISNEVGDSKTFIKLFKQRIVDITLQNWQAKINKSPKANYYKEYKSLLDIEMYLTIDMTYIHQRTLANYRCSNHNLSIEAGRHNKIERLFRYCKYCKYCLKKNVHVVEGEFHFLLKMY